MEAGRHAAQRRPIHAAGLRVLSTIRNEPHVGCVRLSQGIPLIVSNIEAARETLVAAGIEVGEIFHIGPSGRESGPDPEHRTYRSRAEFSDPDGNVWLLQEITTPLPGRVDPGATSFGSASDLESARGGSPRPAREAHRWSR